MMPDFIVLSFSTDWDPALRTALAAAAAAAFPQAQVRPRGVEAINGRDLERADAVVAVPEASWIAALYAQTGVPAKIIDPRTAYEIAASGMQVTQVTPNITVASTISTEAQAKPVTAESVQAALQVPPQQAPTRPTGPNDDSARLKAPMRRRPANG